MVKVNLPGQNIPIMLPDGQINPVWYQALRSIETLTSSALNAANSLRGNPTGVPAAETDIPLGAGLNFAGGALIGTSIDGINGAVTLGNGLARTLQALRVDLTRASAQLGADVLLNNPANYFTGPNLGTLAAGTWFVAGTVTVIDTAATAAIHCKLWDGTTLMSSASGYSSNTARGVAVSLSGFITNAAGDVRISCRDPDATTGRILFNQTGNSMDSHIRAIKVA